MSKERRKHRLDNEGESSSKKKHKDEDNLFKMCFKFKYELNYMLQHKRIFATNSTNVEDFWNFFEKYANIQKKANSNYDYEEREKFLCFKLKEKIDSLYEGLPLYNRHGEKVRLDFKDFKKFISIVLFYIDFKQKERFNTLKKIRRDQSQLPIAEYRDQIIETVRQHNIILIAGDTGCGKSTQVPQYIQKAGFTKIACTQPRRLACISLAKRVAYETLTENNSTIGYQIRFEKTKRKDTSIIFITEGLLLRQASDEEILTSYDVVILDEVHERHLHGDFLIGIMKCLLYKHDKFKLILMSATVNINLYKEYFSNENIKVIQVPGRLYPIDIIYKPIIKDKYDKQQTEKIDPSPYLQVMQMIDEKYTITERGDLLIFLNGIANINALADHIKEYDEGKGRWIILKLHSSLSLAEQDKVFDYAPEGVRKCIISTNIAETSVTIDGIRFVIDSGKVNRMSYSMQGGVNRLKEVTISQDSAKQRSGRAGRTGPGLCYRLYSEKEFNAFEPYTKAEIHLVPLETLVLQMVSMGLSDVMNFPFLEMPDANAIKNAVEKLHFYGALVKGECLKMTVLGEALSKLPVDLTVGKMLITSTIFGNVTPVLCLAAIISIQSPYTNNAFRNIDLQNARKEFESDYGDPITLLNIFTEWLNVKLHCNPLRNSSRDRPENSKQWSHKRGLEEQRFYEVIKLIAQFRDILKESELIDKSISDKNASSAQRAMRHGELKHLKSLKYKLKKEMRNTTKKKLKYSLNEDEEEENSSKLDIRDIELRINVDNNNLQDLLTEISDMNSKNSMILKLILCDGLYPQIAIADEHNYSKPATDQFFHTKLKNYVSLHPMSNFSYNTSLLTLHEEFIEVPPAGYFSRNPLSSRHQILIYQSLLETTKVYLMNVIRMPAIQTLLLFSKKICTNETITKITCDDFLIIDVPYVGQGKSLLLKALKLRKTWDYLLSYKIYDTSNFEKYESMSRILIDDLYHYMHTEVSYTIKRLLKADLKIIYTFTSDEAGAEALKKNIFNEDYEVNQNHNIGGVQVTENVTYNCIVEEEWSRNISIQLSDDSFACPKCQNEIFGRFIDKMIHEEYCSCESV